LSWTMERALSSADLQRTPSPPRYSPGCPPLPPCKYAMEAMRWHTRCSRIYLACALFGPGCTVDLSGHPTSSDFRRRLSGFCTEITHTHRLGVIVASHSATPPPPRHLGCTKPRWPAVNSGCTRACLSSRQGNMRICTRKQAWAPCFTAFFLVWFGLGSPHADPHPRHKPLPPPLMLSKPRWAQHGGAAGAAVRGEGQGWTA
jgi:hypothetical protein